MIELKICVDENYESVGFAWWSLLHYDVSASAIHLIQYAFVYWFARVVVVQ